MCTHLHPDHVGWNTQLEDGRWVPTFPNARYVFARDEYAHWEAESAKGAERIGLTFIDSVLPDITLQQIQHFFEHYKDLEPGKWVQIGDWMDAEAARGLISDAIVRAKDAG
jgi:glyoxylase-like metal-dependent hydrolase (beta-lactamase superfamily II)